MTRKKNAEGEKNDHLYTTYGTLVYAHVCTSLILGEVGQTEKCKTLIIRPEKNHAGSEMQKEEILDKTITIPYIHTTNRKIMRASAPVSELSHWGA